MTCIDELLGVEGTAFVAVLEDRAVRGVGALIWDFLGVSVNCLLRGPTKLDDDSSAFAAPEGGLGPFGRRPAVTKGCRMAA